MKVLAVKPLAVLVHLLSLSLALPAAGKSLEEVTVTALRIPVAPADIIGNYAAVDGKTLELTGPTHIQQALARLPGVNLQHNSGQEYLPAIRSPVLTGAGACGSFLMAEDGIPLRPAGFCNVNELFEAHSEQAARLEVIRGPGVTLYGSNALHGVINVITPTPGSEGSRIGVEAGSEDFYRVRLRTGSETLYAAFTGTTEGSFRDEAGVDQQKLTLGSRHELDGVLLTTGMTAINLNQETAGYIAGSGAYKNDDRVTLNPNPEAYRDAEAARIWARFQDNAAQPSWVITPYARTSDMRFLMHFLPGAPTEENGQDSLGVQTAFYHYAGNSRLTVGVDGEIVDGWLKQFQNSPTQGSAFLRETIPVGDHYDYSVAAIQLAPFVQWDHQLAADWDLSLGARYEWMQYDYNNRMLDGRTRDNGIPCGLGGCRYSRPADSTDNFTNISPKLSLGYSLAEDQRLYLTLARGFRAPQAVELYRLQRAQVVADLESERLDSLELGYQFDGDALDMEIAAYAMKKRNLIFRDSDFFNVDSGRTAHQGIELALAYRLTDALAVSLAATEARHDYDYEELLSGDNINGHAVDGAPRHFGNLVLKWSPTGTTEVELEWLHMGSYYTDPENDHRYPGHDLLNLFGRFSLSPVLSLSGRITNLLDADYADRADFTSFDGDRYIPGVPRAFFLGVDYRW